MFLLAGQVMVISNFSLPPDMQFGEAHIISIIAYSVMFIIGVTTNSFSLYHLLMERMLRKDRNRMTLLLIHLSIADMLVTLHAIFSVASQTPPPPCHPFKVKSLNCLF